MVDDVRVGTVRWARRAADSFLVLAIILLLAVAAMGAPWVYRDPAENVQGDRWPVAAIVIGLMGLPVLAGLMVSLVAAVPLTKRVVATRVVLAVGALVLAVGAVTLAHEVRPTPWTG